MKNEVNSVHKNVSYDSKVTSAVTKQVVIQKVFTRWFEGLFTYLSNGGGEVI